MTESRSSRGYKYTKALDNRKHPIRGLWRRNGQFRAQITVEDEAGRKAIRWVALSAPKRPPRRNKSSCRLKRRRFGAFDPIGNRIQRGLPEVRVGKLFYPCVRRSGINHSPALENRQDGILLNLARRQ